MKVLLTNDDGVHARGLETLKDSLSPNHEVWTVAPDRERSGMSHAVTLFEPLIMHDLGGNTYNCSGTPADCVLYSLLGAISFVPDIVVSGINHGANIGTDIIYSGTVAAARQAALMNIPGVAVSLVTRDGELDFGRAAQFVSEHLHTFVELWDADLFFNVNVPATPGINAAAVVTRPARRVYNDELTRRAGDDGSVVFGLRGSPNGAHPESGTDWAAVEDRIISVSPVQVHPLNQSAKESYHSTQFAALASNKLEG